MGKKLLKKKNIQFEKSEKQEHLNTGQVQYVRSRLATGKVATGQSRVNIGHSLAGLHVQINIGK